MLMEHGFLSRALKHLERAKDAWDARTSIPPEQSTFPIQIKDLSLCEETLKEDVKATDVLLTHTTQMV
jgi:hypothetical protein